MISLYTATGHVSRNEAPSQWMKYTYWCQWKGKNVSKALQCKLSGSTTIRKVKSSLQLFVFLNSTSSITIKNYLLPWLMSYFLKKQCNQWSFTWSIANSTWSSLFDINNHVNPSSSLNPCTTALHTNLVGCQYLNYSYDSLVIPVLLRE